MNRLLGILFTLAAIAAMVFAIINYGDYRSILFAEEANVSEDSIAVEIEMAGDAIESETASELIEIIEVADTTALVR